ncbi:DinB family protein [Rhodopirellula sp. JC740]|uniref:DinB family protein n=1 Tax=Rhodopirellula halodulae TaxID=2894198 RepID=A0ABS8NKF4_9BACT|nr:MULTISPECIES: DinB family protein [unclassified Rhodopirellula]MCC9644024.1 DinB family protein [Rhodopirellula sp. JC740]MCC9657187.1 DinB family protein [Rhodopirellula sp. JC737]
MIGQMIAESGRLCVGYARRLLDGVTEDNFARFARVGDTVIQSNHPAFILGHLNQYPQQIITQLGGDASAIRPSEKYEALFSKTATCLDDPDGTLYPSMNEVVEKFFASHEAAIETLLGTEDAAFQVETPVPHMREKFSTLGSLHAFYFSGHMMLHVGQFSAWRRAMGMGPA